MPRKSKKELQQERQLFAWLGVFLTIIGFVIALILRKEDKYIMYYAKHGLVLFIGFMISWFLYFVPVLGWLLQLFVTVLWIIAWINALSLKKKRTFLVTEIAERIEV